MVVARVEEEELWWWRTVVGVARPLGGLARRGVGCGGGGRIAQGKKTVQPIQLGRWSLLPGESRASGPYVQLAGRGISAS